MPNKPCGCTEDWDDVAALFPADVSAEEIKKSIEEGKKNSYIEKPVRPVDPVKPVRPVDPVKPVYPVKPEEPKGPHRPHHWPLCEKKEVCTADEGKYFNELTCGCMSTY